MSVVPAYETRLCTTCANRTGQQCKKYIDPVTGEEVILEAARVFCNGNDWERSALQSHIAMDGEPQERSFDDPMKTDKATIYKAPPDFIQE